MSDRGWAWEVHPAKTNAAMIAIGQSGDEGKARAHVQEILAAEDGAGWGMILGPGGQTDMCRRGHQRGTFAWRPLWPHEPETR